MRIIRQRLSRRVALTAAAAFIAILAVSVAVLPPVTALGAAVPNISGDWDWNGTTIVLFPPDPSALEFFEVESEGPVMRLICEAWGTLTFAQNGDLFTGSANQDSQCTTQGGQVTARTPFPPSFDLVGSIRGHSLSFESDGGPGIVCSYNGSISVEKGVATRFHTTGGCDVPVFVHPFMTRDIDLDGVRQ